MRGREGLQVAASRHSAGNWVADRHTRNEALATRRGEAGACRLRARRLPGEGRSDRAMTAQRYRLIVMTLELDASVLPVYSVPNAPRRLRPMRS